MQRCPVEKNALCSEMLTAVSSSASSSTTCGFLPPISSCTLARRAAQFCATVLPTATEPVKLTASMPGSLDRSSPITEPRPMIRLNTPAGTPALAMISVSAQAQPGTRSAGLNTTQLPYASAGAIFHAGIASGKFHGVMMPTTPTGSRVISTLMPGRTEGSTSPAWRTTSPAKKRKR